jgi:hypothetical protein
MAPFAYAGYFFGGIIRTGSEDPFPLVQGFSVMARTAVKSIPVGSSLYFCGSAFHRETDIDVA